LLIQPALAGSTWNPSDKNSKIILSNGNLTASNSTSGGTYEGVRATTSKLASSFVFTVTVNAEDSASSAELVAGLADGNFGLSGNYAGGSGNSWGVQAANNNATYASGTGQSAVVACAGSVWQVGGAAIMYFAVNASAGKVWCSTNCKSWGSGTGNPDNGTGPMPRSRPARTGIRSLPAQTTTV